ncbi:MAG TPA: tRNA-dihydrouridine synthase, partial [Burkholderiales bacterium]|nr:tRNA-dihydrouridine synthase [Burkholderiales bacterium]
MNDNDMARMVRRAIEGYFRDLDGEKASGVYDMVINCVEKPLLESVLTRVRGNQTHAAQMLADAARFNVEHGAQIIDINMGCPAKKVCNV